ncbi:hypothetical protein ACS0TY_018520 [Phlomoides rotata]
MSSAQNDKLEKGLAQPLLASTEHDPDDDGSEEASEESRGPVNLPGEAYRLLMPSVKVQLLIYFMLKFSMEILLLESSVVTSHYFGWTTSSVSIFLFCLGLTVLPVNIFVGSYISNMYEERNSSHYPIMTQNHIILGCCLLHNFIRTTMNVDPMEDEVPETFGEVDESGASEDFIDVVELMQSWTSWRENLAMQIYANYV